MLLTINAESVSATSEETYLPWSREAKMSTPLTSPHSSRMGSYGTFRLRVWRCGRQSDKSGASLSRPHRCSKLVLQLPTPRLRPYALPPTASVPRSSGLPCAGSSTYALSLSFAEIILSFVLREGIGSQRYGDDWNLSVIRHMAQCD